MSAAGIPANCAEMMAAVVTAPAVMPQLTTRHAVKFLSGDGVDGRKKVRHRRRAIGGRIVIGLTSEQQPVPRDALVGLAPLFVAPLITESAPLPHVERDRIVVVAVAGFGRLSQRAARRGPHHVDPERREEYGCEDDSAQKDGVHAFGSAAISLSYFAMMTSHE